MSEWKEVKLSMLGNIITGKTPRTAIEENYGGDIPFLTPSDDMSVKHVYFTKKTLSEKGVMEVKSCLLPIGSVCVSCIGSDLGKVVITTCKTVTNQQINSIVVNEKNNNDFVYYLLTIVGKELNRISKTSTAVPIINKSTFSSFEARIPDLFTQSEIAGILSSLDAKIETNNKLNEKLEEMAQAIFKSWFVDFEPFKDQPFHETELGMIPEGWEVCYLGDFIHEIETGKREKGGAINYGIPSIGAEKIERISYYDFSSEKYISWDFYNNLKKGKIKDCDVLLYKDGAYTGKSTMFIDNFPYKECAINEHVFILRTNKKRYQSFLYLFLNQKKIKELIHSLASSKAAQPGLNQKEISSVMFIKPSEDILNNFENMIFPLLKHIVHNLKENQRLASLRDTLLPRLMSGEIKV